jgi:hypothetical protein
MIGVYVNINRKSVNFDFRNAISSGSRYLNDIDGNREVCPNFLAKVSASISKDSFPKSERDLLNKGTPYRKYTGTQNPDRICSIIIIKKMMKMKEGILYYIVKQKSQGVYRPHILGAYFF